MKVHLVKVFREETEYMCLNDLGNPQGCQMCYLYGSKLSESKLKPPKNIKSKCPECDENLVNFFELPNEQKIALEGKRELDFLVEKVIYCSKCKTSYINF